jgi:hypothetical protein
MLTSSKRLLAKQNHARTIDIDKNVGSQMDSHYSENAIGVSLLLRFSGIVTAWVIWAWLNLWNSSVTIAQSPHFTSFGERLPLDNEIQRLHSRRAVLQVLATHSLTPSSPLYVTSINNLNSSTSSIVAVHKNSPKSTL